MTEWTKYRDEIEERLIEDICDDANTAIEYLDIKNEIEERVSRKIEQLGNHEFRILWDKHFPWSIEDQILEIES